MTVQRTFILLISLASLKSLDKTLVFLNKLIIIITMTVRRTFISLISLASLKSLDKTLFLLIQV